MVTQKEIAKKLKISQITVSRTINNSPLVTDSTKKIVLNEIKKSGYSFNSNARNLHLNKSGVIGILLPGSKSMENHYFASSFIGINDELNKSHSNLLLINIKNKNDIKDKLPLLLNKLDGLIIYNIRPMKKHLKSVIDLLCKKNKAYVIIQSYRDSKLKNYITVDNVDAGRKATEYLLKLGHEKIVFYGDLLQHECKERLKGYIIGLQKNGIRICEEWIVQKDENNSGIDGLRSIFSQKNTPDAIFAWSDHFARIAIYELRLLGKETPNDVSVIGFDDSHAFVYMDSPHLTTVKQPLSHIGSSAVKTVLSGLKMDSPDFQKAIIIERDSCKKSKRLRNTNPTN